MQARHEAATRAKEPANAGKQTRARKRTYADGRLRIHVSDVSALLAQAESEGESVKAIILLSRLTDGIVGGGRPSRGVATAFPDGSLAYAYSYFTGKLRKRRNQVRGTVKTIKVPCHFGGFRRLFVCPETGAHVAALYLVADRKGRRFISMKAAGMAYRSQSADKTERLGRKAKRVARRLTDGVDVRPHGMHRKTFRQIRRRLGRIGRELIELADQ